MQISVCFRLTRRERQDDEMVLTILKYICIKYTEILFRIYNIYYFVLTSIVCREWRKFYLMTIIAFLANVFSHTYFTIILCCAIYILSSFVSYTNTTYMENYIHTDKYRKYTYFYIFYGNIHNIEILLIPDYLLIFISLKFYQFRIVSLLSDAYTVYVNVWFCILNDKTKQHFKIINHSSLGKFC